jgi:hypothetical protein
MTLDTVATINENINFTKDKNVVSIISEGQEFELHIVAKLVYGNDGVQVLKEGTELNMSINKRLKNPRFIEWDVFNYTGFRYIEVARVDGEEFKISDLKKVKFRGVKLQFK